MKIDRFSGIATGKSRRGGRKSSGESGSFSGSLEAAGEPAAAPGVSGAGAPHPVDSLVAIQEVSNELIGRRQARKRGEELLDELDDLRLGLLEGRMSAAAVDRLADLVAAKRDEVDDPRLAGLLDEIKLRVAVELAKLGR